MSNDSSASQNTLTSEEPTAAHSDNSTGSAKNSDDPVEESGLHTGSLTQQPFGETEKQVRRTAHGGEETHPFEDELADVEPLDLDQPAESKGANLGPSSRDTKDKNDSITLTAPSTPATSTASPSSLLNTATSLLPSIPFLSSSKPSSPSRSKEPSPERETKGSGPDFISEKEADKEGRPIVSRTSAPENPKNPLQARPGESPDRLERDTTLSSYKADADLNHIMDPEKTIAELPKISAGEGEGPDVVYGKDVVLDMAGYHSAGKATEEHEEGEKGMTEEALKINAALKAAKVMEENASTSPSSRAEWIEKFAQDLLSCIPAHAFDVASSSRPPLPAARTQPDLPQLRGPGGQPMDMDHSDIANQETAAMHSEPDLSVTLDSLSLESTQEPSPSRKGTSPGRRRGDRGQSEPTPDLEDEMSVMSMSAAHPPTALTLSRQPNGSIYPYANPLPPPPRPTTPVNHLETWDWAKVPPLSPEVGGVEDVKRSTDMERSASGPPLKTGSPKKSKVSSRATPSASLDLATPSNLNIAKDPMSSTPGRLKPAPVDEYGFVLDMDEGRSYAFEIALCAFEDLTMDHQPSVGHRFES